MSDKQWQIASAHTGENVNPRLPGLVMQVLSNRGVQQGDEMQRFMKPSLHDLHPPDSLGDCLRAADLIAEAIGSDKKIVLYGDYDVDGITGLAILYHVIALAGKPPRWYIPHRVEEGYGLNPDAVKQLAQDGCELLITIDCGIASLEEVALADSLGMNVIVTDHHQPGSALPAASAIVHPALPGGAYPFGDLCGAGVAFKLAWALARRVCGQEKVSPRFRRFLVEATSLAALGTIADVVPLVGENRILATFGLRGIPATNLTGLKALLASTGLADKKLDAYHVGYLLGPRLNAAGRMGHAREAVDMFTTTDPDRADEIAKYLEDQNRQRRNIEKQILTEAVHEVEKRGYHENLPGAMVLGKPGWHPGVIGIVASRLVDRYHRPAILLGWDEGSSQAQGSGRSIAGFDLAKALEACGEFLDGFGGHRMAAGLKLPPERLDAFAEAFDRYARANLDDEQLRPVFHVDAEVKVSDLTADLATWLGRLAPFGCGNPRPILAARDCCISRPPRRVGKNGNHLQLTICQAGRNIRAVAFNHGDWFDPLASGEPFNVAFELVLNDYTGRPLPELHLRDLQFP